MKEEAVEDAELVLEVARAHRMRVIMIVTLAFVCILALVLNLADTQMLEYEWI